MISLRRARKRPYDNQATRGQNADPIPYEVTQPPLHEVAFHSGTDGFAYDETRTRRKSVLPRDVRAVAAVQMDDEERAAGPASPSYRGREVLAPPQPMLGRQHDVMT
jgi:hypothetical protein